MNINDSFRLRWTIPTFRTDGVRISGALTFSVEIKSKNGDVVFTANTQFNFLDVTPLSIPLRPGKYKASVKSIENTIDELGVSENSDDFEFTLESIADPLPPTGVTI